MRSSSRGLVRRLALAAAIAGFALAAAAPAFADEVSIKAGGDATSFTGTDKNTSAQTTNFVSIGTSAGTGNPVTAFTFDGKACTLYSGAGSGYCSTTVAPGATVNFSVSTTAATDTFVFCTSANGGIDNACQNVTVGAGASGSVENVIAAINALKKNIAKIAKRLNGGRRDKGPGSDAKAVRQLEKQLTPGVTGKFPQTIYGVPAQTLLDGFVRIDDEFDVAIESVTLVGTGSLNLGSAASIKDRLVEELRKESQNPQNPTPAPGDLFVAFDELDREIKAVERGSDGFTEDEERSRIARLGTDKAKLRRTYFSQLPLFAVPFSTVSAKADKIGGSIATAATEAKAGESDEAADHLKDAEKACDGMLKIFTGTSRL